MQGLQKLLLTAARGGGGSSLVMVSPLQAALVTVLRKQTSHLKTSSKQRLWYYQFYIDNTSPGVWRLMHIYTQKGSEQGLKQTGWS